MTALTVLVFLALLALALVLGFRIVFWAGFQLGGNDERMLHDLVGDERAQAVNDAADQAINGDDYEADRRSWL